MDRNGIRPPADLGNAVASKRKYVSADSKTLTPAGGN
jgi:hypothetical protein